MSIAITIADNATPMLTAVTERVRPERLAAAVGRGVLLLVRQHFVGNGTNKQGWPSTHFWARAAKATTLSTDAEGVTVVCNQIGVRQRYYGGPIKPVKAKMLTIPARADAYGKTAREFSDLQVKMLLDPATNRMRLALVEKAGTNVVKLGRKRKDGTRSEKVVAQKTGLAPLYWLARKVTQKGDAGVIPSDAEFMEEIQKRVETVVEAAN